MDDRWSWIDDLADHPERVAKNIVLPAGWAADKALFCAYSLGDAKASAWWCRPVEICEDWSGNG